MALAWLRGYERDQPEASAWQHTSKIDLGKAPIYSFTHSNITLEEKTTTII